MEYFLLTHMNWILQFWFKIFKPFQGCKIYIQRGGKTIKVTYECQTLILSGVIM